MDMTGRTVRAARGLLIERARREHEKRSDDDRSPLGLVFEVVFVV